MAIVQSIFFLFCYFRLAEISPVICTSCRYPLSGSMILARSISFSNTVPEVLLSLLRMAKVERPKGNLESSIITVMRRLFTPSAIS